MCDRCAPSSVDRRRFLQLAGAAGVVGAFGGVIASTAQASAIGPTVPPVAVADALSIYPRGAWANAAPTGPLQAETPQFILVHHSAEAAPTEGAVVDTLRQIFRYHTGPARGWPDVCYNFFIDPFGGVWEGRQGSIAGPVEASATGGSQGFGQLVCLLGNYMTELPTSAAIDALERTLIWLATRDGIDVAPSARTTFTSRGSNRYPAGAIVDTSTIAGHRDMSLTECPGDVLYPFLVGPLRDHLFLRATGAEVTSIDQLVAASINPATGAPFVANTADIPPAGSTSTNADTTSRPATRGSSDESVAATVAPASATTGSGATTDMTTNTTTTTTTPTPTPTTDASTTARGVAVASASTLAPTSDVAIPAQPGSGGRGAVLAGVIAGTVAIGGAVAFGIGRRRRGDPTAAEAPDHSMWIRNPPTGPPADPPPSAPSGVGPNGGRGVGRGVDSSIPPSTVEGGWAAERSTERIAPRPPRDER